MRVQTGVPGLGGHLRRRAGDAASTSRPTPRCPTEQPWSTERISTSCRRLSRRCASEFGLGFQLLHDVHHRLTPIEAGAARASAWSRTRCPGWRTRRRPSSRRAFRLIRQHTTTPIAVGEVFNTIWDCQQLITEQLIDYIRTTVVHAGGITHLRRIFDLAALYHVRSGSHGATDLSPVALAAALHLDTQHPRTSGSRSTCRTRRRPTRSSRTATASRTGYLHPSEEPGLGVDIDEDAAARYPYQPRYLPVNRRRDGSMHDW